MFGKDWLSGTSRQDRHPLRVGYGMFRSPPTKIDQELAQPFLRAIKFSNDLKAVRRFRSKTGLNGRAGFGNHFFNKIVREAQGALVDFDGAEFEVMVAQLYQNLLKIPIVSIFPSSDASVKTPDFEIEFAREKIYLECKARTTWSPQWAAIEQARSRLRDKVVELITSCRICYGIRIATERDPAEGDIEPIIKELDRLVAAGGEFDQTVGDYRLSGSVLSPWNSEHRLAKVGSGPPEQEMTQLPAFRRFLRRFPFQEGKNWRGMTVLSGVKRVGSGALCKNPKLLVIDFLVVPYHVKAVAGLVNKARKQLVKGARNIVFINAPDFYGTEQFKELGRRVRGAMMATTRVSATTLWHRTVSVNPSRRARGSTTGLKLTYQNVSLRNPNAAAIRLSDEFFRDALPPSNIES